MSALGFGLQSARTQERQAVSEALRPLIIVLIALGMLAFVATGIAAAQIIQRDRDRWRADNVALASLGMARTQLVLVQLVTSLAIALVAIAMSLLAMYLISPLAPAGPLHDFDPAQRFSVDALIAALGIVVLLLSMALLTVGLNARRTKPLPQLATPTAWVDIGGSSSGRDRGPEPRFPEECATVATLALARGLDRPRWRCSRSSPRSWWRRASLITTPSRYGYNFDLLVVNQFGDQTKDGLNTALRDDRGRHRGYRLHHRYLPPRGPRGAGHGSHDDQG